MSPYSDSEKQREANREASRRYRQKGVIPRDTVIPVIPENVTPVIPDKKEDVIPKDITQFVTPLDPWDWSDRRNFSEAYLKCLDEQGGHLTEASIVALKITRKPFSERPIRPVDPAKKAKAKAVLASFS